MKYMLVALLALVAVAYACDQCSDTQTCCDLGDGQVGCCPLAAAVCCSDKAHCCPANTVCNPPMCTQQTSVFPAMYMGQP